MEQRGEGGGGGGGRSPSLRDSVSPEEVGERGESPELSGPPPGKTSRLEVNGSPTGSRARFNGTLLRPLGGGGKHIMYMMCKCITSGIKQPSTFTLAVLF